MSVAQVLSTRSKFVSLVAGASAGVGLHVLGSQLLPSAEREQQLRDNGIEVVSNREAAATLGPMLFAFAAAVGAGVGKRSDTAGLSTTLLGAATMFASTGASTVVNANNDGAGTYLGALGAMSGVAAAGFGVGAVNRIPLNMSKQIGLAGLGISMGLIAPSLVGAAGGIPGLLRDSYEQRGQ